MTLEEKINVGRNLCKHTNYTEINFTKLYPFTTENIAGYLPFFDLKNKSVLTVGSSCDQALNAIYKGCKEITIIDISYFTKEYFDLKKSAILNMSKEEYLDFLNLLKKTKYGIINPQVFQKESFQKLRDDLQKESMDSYRFWKTLLDEFPSMTVRRNLFIPDEDGLEVIQKKNAYLKSDEDFQQLKENIKKITPVILRRDIRKNTLRKKYDIIFLSNILDYLKKEEAEEVISNYKEKLSEDGKFLLYYLYQTTTKEEKKEIKDLYDKTGILKELKEEFVLQQFEGVRSYLDHSKTMDGIITYQKKRH